MSQSYKNQSNLNAYNFLYRPFFENLTGNMIVHILKNKITNLFSLKFIFKIFKKFLSITILLLSIGFPHHIKVFNFFGTPRIYFNCLSKSKEWID